MSKRDLAMENPLPRPGLSFSGKLVEVEPGVELRVLGWRPEREEHRPVLFVSGWVSTIHGWLDLLGGLAENRRVLYLETREKASAQIASRRLSSEDFSIERIAKDIISAGRVLDLQVEESVLMGSSLGATAILEAMKHGGLMPHAAFLIGPNARFRFPSWGAGVVHLPVAAFYPAQVLIRWYLRTFRVDVKREPEQMRRYDASIRQADPLRLKLSARAVRHYHVWQDLSTICRPVAIAYAESDSLHAADEVGRLARALPGAVTVPCPSNRFMHSAELLPRIDGFLKSLSPAS